MIYWTIDVIILFILLKYVIELEELQFSINEQF